MTIIQGKKLENNSFKNIFAVIFSVLKKHLKTLTLCVILYKMFVEY